MSANKCEMYTLQVKALVTPFGKLQAFNLVMDKHTGNSKVGMSSQPFTSLW